MKYITLFIFFITPQIIFAQLKLAGLSNRYDKTVSKINFNVINQTDSTQKYIIAVEDFDNGWHETLSDINNFQRNKEVFLHKLEKLKTRNYSFYPQKFDRYKLIAGRYRFRIDLWDNSTSEFTISIYSDEFMISK